MLRERVYVWKELLASRTLRRTLYIFMIVTVVLFFAILTISMNQLISNMNERSIQQAETTLYYAQSFNETTIHGIYQYMLSCLESYEVRGLLYSKEYTSYLAIHSRDIYDQLTRVSSLVHNVQMVNFSTRTVLDRNGRYNFSEYGDQDLLELLDTLEPTTRTNLNYFPRTMNISASKLMPNNYNVISFIIYQNNAGALIVNIDYPAYEKAVLAARSGTHSSYYLVNNTGTLLCGADENSFGQNFASDEAYRRMVELGASSGSFPLADGKRMVNYRRNAAQGVSYLAITEMEGIYLGSSFFWQMVGLAALFLIASVIISLVLALLTSKPIRTLHRSVKDQLNDEILSDTDEPVDEISFLGNVYQNILDSNRALTEHSRAHQLERESYMLLNLMNPATPLQHASAATIAELETALPHPLFRVIALMPDRRRIQMETDAATIRRTLAAKAGEMLRTLGSVRVVFPPAFQVLLLVNMDEQEPVYIQSILNETLNECSQSLSGMTLYMGVGETVNSLDDLNVSYSGAVEAVQHAYIKQLSCVVFRENITFPDPQTQAYAFDLDEEITKAIRHMKFDAAEDAVCRFFDRVSGYNHNQFVRSTLHLDVVLQRLELSLQLGSASTRIDTATVSHWNAEDACQYFRQRAQRDIAQMLDMKRSSSTSDELIQKIDQMIDDCIYDPDFSIAQLADKFSFSINYLRSLYKNSAGESLSSRITRKRVEVACTLLDTTDESIEAITAKLGFSTRNYFFTFFKKHMGMTPAQYRNRENG